MTYNLNFDDLLKHMMNRYELIHQDALITLDALGEEVGQAFTSRIHGLRLTDAVFYISRNAAFNGTLVANLYEIAVGTVVGTTAIPAGAALATSDNVTQADIAVAIGLVNFHFPAPYTLVPGHAYAIVIEVTVLAAGQVNVGIDNSTPTHTGNLVEFLVGVWVPQAAQDCIFYLFSFWDAALALALSTPLQMGSIFNVAVLANTNFFAADLAPTNTPRTFRIYVCLDTAGVFNVQRTQAAVTVAEELNQGNVLNANAAYMFDILVEADDTINFQTTVGAQILKCQVLEVSP